MFRLKLPSSVLMIAFWMPLVEVGQTGEQQFPYVAFVTEAEAYVRSGPGQKYYPTQQLPQGFAVEVYRHDGDGWCAIRPPTGSFSWVAAHQVRPVSQGIGEVVAEEVVTRIGSSLSPARTTVQVLLPQGERVELQPHHSSDSPGWLRIAAPAGEFRWIAADQLSRQPPLESTPPPSSNGWNNQTVGNSVLAAAPLQPADAFRHLQSANPLPSEQPLTSQPAPVANAFHFESQPQAAAASFDSQTADPDAIEIVAGSPADQSLAENHSPLGTLSSNTSSTPTLPQLRFYDLSQADRSIAERIDELQLRISQIVLESPQDWQFDQLQSEAAGLLEKAESPSVRSHLRDILDRVARFQRVRQGYGEISNAIEPDNNIRQQTLPEEEGLTGMSSKVRQLARNDLDAPEFVSSDNFSANSKADKPLYDAVGLLKPVSSKRAKAPQYALVDDKGDVVSFITPTPDLNLKPYLGRRIGVHGKRGFMPEYRRAHVTADRISPIEAPLRR